MSDLVPILPGMTAEEDEAVRHACNAVLRHISDWDFASLSAGFRAVQQRLEPALADRPNALLSLRRMIAQSIHMMSNDKELPLADCRRLLDETLALGYEELYEKVAHVAAFARLCLRQGQPEQGLACLEPLLAEVESTDHLGREEHLTLLRELHDALRGG